MMASQIANHIRVALAVKDDPAIPTHLRDLIDRHIEFYKAGAAGPDTLTNIAGVAAHKHFDQRGDSLSQELKYGYSLAKDAHYKRTGQLLTHMMRIASTEKDVTKREQHFVFALGWLTHYWVDVYEHRLVNNYGGFYEIDPLRHKHLEGFETTHVFVMGQYPLDAYVARSAGFPTDFVNRAFGATFPDYWDSSLKERTKQRATRIMRKVFKGSDRAWGITKDLDAAAYAMELFTQSMVDKYRQQEQNMVSFHAEFAIGRKAPLKNTYAVALDPLMVLIEDGNIDTQIAEDEVDVKVVIDCWVMDATLQNAYITQWYPHIESALAALTADFKRLAGQVHPGPDGTILDAQIGGFFQDMNYDTGFHENEGNHAAKQASEKYAPIATVEVAWTIETESGKELGSGTETVKLGDQPNYAERTAVQGNFHQQIALQVAVPARELDVDPTPAVVTAEIKAINPIPHLIAGKFLKGLQFNFQEGRLPQPESPHRIAVISDRDRTKFELPSRIDVAMESDPSETQEPGSYDLSDITKRLAEILARLAAIQAEAQQHLRSGKDALIELAPEPSPAATNTAAIQSLIDALSQKMASAAGLLTMAEQASHQVARCRDNAEAAALEACQLAEQLQDAATRAQAGPLRDRAELAAQAAGLQADLAVEAFSRTKDAAFAIREIQEERVRVKARQFEICRGQQTQIDEQTRRRSDRTATVQAAIQALRALASERDGLVSEGLGLVLEGKGRLVEFLPSETAVRDLDHLNLQEARLQSYGQAEIGYRELERGLSQTTMPVATSPENDRCDPSLIPEFDETIVREAAAWVDAAELFVDPAMKAARSAAVCAGVRWDPPPPRPQPSTPPITTATPSDDPGEPSGNRPTQPSNQPDYDVPGADRAIAAAERLAQPPNCQYDQAHAKLDEAERLNPVDRRIPRIRQQIAQNAEADQNRQRTLNQAWQAYVDGHFDVARSYANSALAMPSNCADGDAGDLLDRINREQARVDKVARQERNRQAASDLVDGLIGIAQTVQAIDQARSSGTSVSGSNRGQTSHPSGQSANYSACSIMSKGHPEGSSQWGLFQFGSGNSIGYMLLQGPRPDPEDPYTIDDWSRDAKAALGAGGAHMNLIMKGSYNQVRQRVRQLCPNPVYDQSY